MSRPRRSRLRNGGDLSPLAWAMLTDEVLPPIVRGSSEDWERFFLKSRGDALPNGRLTLQGLWKVHGDEIVSDWASAFPGTRPSCWWRWNATEPRQRVGGIGTPVNEVLGQAQAYHLGLPTFWVTRWEEDYHNNRLWDVEGRPIGPEDKRPFAGFAISVSNPPRYEAQATYLERHRLLLPSERARVPEEGFRPELVTADGD